MNKIQEIKNIKHGKIILTFITIVLLILLVGRLSKTSEVKCEEYKRGITIVDTDEKHKCSIALVLDTSLTHGGLPKNLEFEIKNMKQVLEVKTLVEGCSQIANETLVTWLLDMYYSDGYRIACVVGDWIILELR